MTTEQIYWINTDGERYIATGDELQEILDAIAASDARKKAEKLESAEKAKAKAAAEAKLVALGLDLDDLRALGL